MARITRRKEKAVRREAIQITSPFGDPEPDSLNSTIPSENHLPGGRVADPPLCNFPKGCLHFVPAKGVAPIHY